MSEKLTPIIEQFGMVDGARQNTPHNQAAVREPKNIGRSKGNLFVLVEVQGKITGLTLVEKRLVALVRDTYYPAHGGITAGLRRAINAANQWLYQYNTSNEDPLIGGVVAVVMREDDLFVAQIGPAVIFTSLNNFVRRHPEKSAWLDAGKLRTDDYAPALGIHHFVEPYITHLQIQPGDIVLLADGQLARRLSTQQVSQVMANNKAGTVGKNLAQAAQSRRGSALVLQITAQREKNSISALKGKIPASVSDTSSTLADAKKGFNFSLPVALPRLRGASAPSSAYQEQNDASANHNDKHADYDNEGDAPLNAGDGANPITFITHAGQTLVTAIMEAVAFLGSGLHTILKLILPGSHTETPSTKQAGRQAQAIARKQPSRQALLYVAFALPVIAIVITLLMYWYKGYSQENEYLAALDQAEQSYQQAQLSVPETARNLLDEADQHLSEAAAIKAGQEQVTALQNTVEERRDEINNVQRLYYVPELRRYTDPETNVDGIVVQGANVYVLDGGLGRVFHHTLDDIGDALLPDSESPVLMQQGQKVDNMPIGNLLDVVWMPAGGGRQTSDLLVLQQDGLIEFDPDWGATAIAVYGVDQWQKPVAAGSYFGNFYVLDSQANKILRYLPAANGYENPPESYFADGVEVNLAGAVDMAIDGAIYVLYQDGRIEKFVTGQPAEFQITGLDVPLKNPVAIYTAPDELAQNLYIADAGNRRIVQLTKNGQFVRQLKPRTEDGIVFDNLQAIYVDEIGEKMYVLNDNNLYAPNLSAQ